MLEDSKLILKYKKKTYIPTVTKNSPSPFYTNKPTDMKAKIYFFSLLLIGSLFASCKKSDIEYDSDFNKSNRAWANFKASSGNSYRFMIGTGSWTGYGTETIITVRNGIVVGRSYVAKAIIRPATTATIMKEWVEDESNLNTHAEGATSVTLDEIYHKAKTDWLLKRKDATTSFEAKNNGLISSAGYVPNGCADDCFRGISIVFIEKL